MDLDFKGSAKFSGLAPGLNTLLNNRGILNSAWRFGVGARHQVSEGFHWGVSAEYLYGGTLDVDKQSRRPVALGGSGDVDGSYDNTGAIILALYGSWKF